jgi:apolipoprotein N-acyltransferase
MAAMRAVENGMYLVRAANTGISAVVAPSGRIVAQTPLLTEAALVATISPRQARTPYSRVGDVFPWACLICFAASALLPRARRRATL